ncbi:ABC transporter permease (plasmid) [Roseomonas marmotae]|nr:ABC transporter permease [Roseomonas marmotae]QTI82113.1 ABC transporter permease [Roseomonas marmotae]
MALLVIAFAASIAALLWSSLAADGMTLIVAQLADPMMQRILWRTVWIAVATTLLCLLLGYPLALFLARSPRRDLWLMLVISPWLVSIVVRTFGWMVLLGNRGVLNEALRNLGLIDMPIRILFTPTAVLIGLTHVLLPFMVIALLSSLLRQDIRLEEAARVLGATGWQSFRRVTLPLSLPGVLGGCSLVLLISTGAIVTPLLLGGLRDRMLGTQIYTEIFQIFDFARASAMATILLVVSLLLVMPLQMWEGRLRRRGSL